MYDTLTTSYTFACPVHGETSRAPLALPPARAAARARSIPRSTASSSTAAAATTHPGLVTHDELDWAPLGLHDATPFVNLMTSRIEALGGELGELAATRIKAGEWPWSFFCWPEERPRPVFPSAFRLLAPAASGDRVGLAVRCPVCGKVSVNLVIARARRRAVRQRPRGRSGGAPLRGRRRRDGRRSSTPSSGRRASTPAASDLSSRVPSRQGFCGAAAAPIPEAGR